MIIGIVIGNVWATKKEDALNGLKLMVVQRIDPADGKRHESLVAADCVGAVMEKIGSRKGDLLEMTPAGNRMKLEVTGSSARKALASPGIPVDAAIVGILDEVEITKGL